MVARLANHVQTYAWGHPRAIWDLIGRDPAGPGAELWMGAHPVAPSRLAGTGVGLDEVIGRDPAAALGPAAARDFDGRLPFLFKVLAAGQALSLQAHPDAARARAGFGREEASGRPLTDPRRTYRDPSHKPELICAVTAFWACCGFRDLGSTRALLEDLDTPVLDPLRRRLADGGADDVLGGALRWLLTLEPATARDLVDATAGAAASSSGSDFADERSWTCRLAEQYPGDPGVVVALLLNLVRLEPGEALFLGAGNLHCYLEGVGVEVMANSDNVVRGGLTAKHVDLDELLDVVDATPVPVAVQRPSPGVHTYRTPVPEFALTRLELDGTEVRRNPGPRIVLVLEGRVELSAGPDELELGRGESAWVAAAEGPLSIGGSGLAYEVALGPG